MTRVHIVGGGLAGLAAALDLTQAGRPVTVYEAGPAFGGRCRSYFDKELGCRLDNGNHLLLSGNHAAMDYLRRLGMQNSMAGPKGPVFHFMDLGREERWALRLSRSRIPFWLLRQKTRVPGTYIRDYLPLLSLGHARPGDTVASALPHNELYRRLIEPLAVSALNTPAYRGSARLFGAVIDETLTKGGAHCIPMFPRAGLSESFVDPAVARLRAAGATLHTTHRIAGIGLDGPRVRTLAGPHGPYMLAPTDKVVLAVPPSVATAMVPGLDAPDEFQAILNLHYRVQVDPGETGFIGLIGGMAEWIFIKPGIVSVTISAANRLMERASEELAALVWGEIRLALRLSGDVPPYRVLREKRATFAATFAQHQRRPSATTAIENLVLAGDWTATGLPATIEGAIRSGFTAAKTLHSAA
jgi:squalene-associated FAD-dependent desaturase